MICCLSLKHVVASHVILIGLGALLNRVPVSLAMRWSCQELFQANRVDPAFMRPAVSLFLGGLPSAELVRKEMHQPHVMLRGSVALKGRSTTQVHQSCLTHGNAPDVMCTGKDWEILHAIRATAAPT